MSLIRPETVEVLALWARTRRLGEAAPPLYGSALADWPAWIVDAFDVLTAEEARYEEARWRAERYEDR